MRHFERALAAIRLWLGCLFEVSSLSNDLVKGLDTILPKLNNPRVLLLYLKINIS